MYYSRHVDGITIPSNTSINRDYASSGKTPKNINVVPRCRASSVTDNLNERLDLNIDLGNSSSSRGL